MLETPASPAMIPPQKQMTGMLGHPVAENPIDADVQAWEPVDRSCTVVDVITNPRITPEEAVFQKAVASALGEA